MDRALLVLCALLLNAFLGGPRRWYEAAGLARLGRIPAKLLRETERYYRGEPRRKILMAGVLLAATIAGLLLLWLFEHGIPFTEFLLLACVLPVRPVWDRISQIKKALQAGNLAAARGALEGTVWRHHALLDEHGVARAGIELLAVQFSEKIVNTVLWYLLLSWPGLLIGKSIRLMQETLHPSFDAETRINRILWKIPALFQYISSRLAALLWMAAALFLPFTEYKKACAEIMRLFAKAPSRQLMLQSAGSVLRLSLGGPSSAYGTPWTESGTAKAMPSDVRRALYAFALLNLLLFILVGLLLF